MSDTTEVQNLESSMIATLKSTDGGVFSFDETWGRQLTLRASGNDATKSYKYDSWSNFINSQAFLKSVDTYTYMEQEAETHTLTNRQVLKSYFTGTSADSLSITQVAGKKLETLMIGSKTYDGSVDILFGYDMDKTPSYTLLQSLDLMESISDIDFSTDAVLSQKKLVVLNKEYAEDGLCKANGNSEILLNVSPKKLQIKISPR